MESYIDIESHFEGKLQIIYLNDPSTYNSLNPNMLLSLRNKIHVFSKDDKVRCVAISGRGKSFCSGQNLKEALNLGDIKKDRAVQRFVIEYYNPLVKEIVNCRKPVISLVNGSAVGAGAMLALICDFTLATESSYFAQAFSLIGLIPDTAGTYFLPKLLGRQMANYLAFTGKKISASEAQNLGLIAEVFIDKEFESESMKVLEQLSNSATKALSLTKKAINESYSNTLNEQLDLEGILQQDAAETSDFIEGISAFLEKRNPNYNGK